MAGPLRIELRIAESKSAVIPFNYEPTKIKPQYRLWRLPGDLIGTTLEGSIKQVLFLRATITPHRAYHSRAWIRTKTLFFTERLIFIC